MNFKIGVVPVAAIRREFLKLNATVGIDVALADWLKPTALWFWEEADQPAHPFALLLTEKFMDEDEWINAASRVVWGSWWDRYELPHY
jgi:hypothetical protein